jgi:WD40 repeat protein
LGKTISDEFPVTGSLIAHETKEGGMAIRLPWLRCRRSVLLSITIVLLLAARANAQNELKFEIVANIPHSQGVKSVAFSRDGTHLLSGSQDATLKLWDTDTGKVLRTFVGHTDGVNSVAFSPDGTRALSGSWDKTLKLWDVATGTVLRTLEGHTDGINSVAFSPDGALVLSGSQDKTVKLWNAETGQLLRTFEGHAGSVNAVAFSPDGALLFSGSEDKTLKVWNSATGELVRTIEGHQQAVDAVAVSFKGNYLLSGSEDKTVKLWDTATGQLLRMFDRHNGVVAAVSVSPDGTSLLSAGEDKVVRLWEVASGRLLKEFVGPADWINSVAFSPDGTHVVAASWDNTLKLWDVASAQLSPKFAGQTDQLYAIALSADGARLLAGGEDKTVRLWSAESGQLLQFGAHEERVNAVAFSPDGTRLLSGSSDKMMKLWDAATGRLVRTFQGHASAINSVAYSRDGTRVLSGSEDATVKLWDVRTGELLRTLDGNAGAVHSVTFSPDGGHVVSGNNDKTLKLWDTATGQLLRTLEGHAGAVNNVAFSPDGTRLLSGSQDRTLKLWDAVTGQLVRTFEGHTNEVNAVAFSPDGNQLLSGSTDNTLKLWDAATGQLLRTFMSQAGSVYAVAYSPDGVHAVSGGADSAIRIWNVKTGELLTTVIGSADKEWVAITPAGFFAASRNGTGALTVVRGFEAYSVMQFYDHLYRPDLIGQLLKGDPLGKYADAASRINLEKIFNSGRAPQIQEIPGRRIERTNDIIKVSLRLVEDSGGGIGSKVVWRLNGVAEGEDCAARTRNTSTSNFRVVTHCLKIDPTQKSIIEVTAYNGAGLLATEPYRIEYKSDVFGITTDPRPRMYVLAVGVSKYANPEWRLDYAESDAKSVARTFEAVGRALYDDVQTITVLDEEATAVGIEAAINRMKGNIRSGDVFVLFIAGHGISVAGTYYFIPQDFQPGLNKSVMTDGISQDTLNSWITKIPALKSIMILDTCQSATATRALDPELVTAIDRLQHATGRSIITAASGSAIEGYKNHGLLTYVVLQALTKTRVSDPEEVTVSQVADQVEHEVPILSRSIYGIEQWPHQTIADDFPLGKRVAERAEGVTAIPRAPTHVLIREELVRERPASNAPGNTNLAPGTQVRVVDVVGTWVVVAREGQKLGYVPEESISKLH